MNTLDLTPRQILQRPLLLACQCRADDDTVFPGAPCGKPIYAWVLPGGEGLPEARCRTCRTDDLMAGSVLPLFTPHQLTEATRTTDSALALLAYVQQAGVGASIQAVACDEPDGEPTFAVSLVWLSRSAAANVVVESGPFDRLADAIQWAVATWLWRGLGL